MTPYYIIVGQHVDDTPTYWQEGFGWTESEEFATHYTADILTESLPTGACSVAKVDETGIILLAPCGGGRGMQIFEEII